MQEKATLTKKKQTPPAFTQRISNRLDWTQALPSALYKEQETKVHGENWKQSTRLRIFSKDKYVIRDAKRQRVIFQAKFSRHYAPFR